MDFLQLKYFQDVAMSEKISKTAEKYMVPPSCVSVYIKKLEEELGVKLFDRTANRIKLNNNGKIFLTSVNNAFLELDMAKNKLSNISEVQSGEITLLIATNRKIITEYIEEYRKDFSQVSFKLEHRKSMSYTDYDIVVSDQKIDSTLFDKKLLIKEKFKLAVNKDHPLAACESVDVEDLRNERFVCMPKGSSIRQFTERICAAHGFIPYITVESDDPYYIREYIGMGMGVSLVPEFSWDGLYSDKVLFINLTDSGFFRKTYVYTKKNAPQFVTAFSERIASL